MSTNKVMRSSKKKFAKGVVFGILLLFGKCVYCMDTNDSGSGNRTLIEKHIRDTLFSPHHIARMTMENGAAAAPLPTMVILAFVIIFAFVVLFTMY